jgi:AcrR family transcriptional regulator
MVRKIQNARELFEKAALELFQERGYAEATVPEIAARAGHTERSFYRYFSDKPEVLFWRAGDFEAGLVEAIRAAPKGTGPLEAVVTAFEQAVAIFDGRREDANTRRALIASHPEFQAREMMKMRSLVSGIDQALRERNVRAATARITAEVGVAVFRVAFAGWSNATGSRGFRHFLRASLKELDQVVIGDNRNAS